MRASVKAYATPRPPESTQNHSYESRLDPDPLSRLRHPRSAPRNVRARDVVFDRDRAPAPPRAPSLRPRRPVSRPIARAHARGRAFKRRDSKTAAAIRTMRAMTVRLAPRVRVVRVRPRASTARDARKTFPSPRSTPFASNARLATTCARRRVSRGPAATRTRRVRRAPRRCARRGSSRVRLETGFRYVYHAFERPCSITRKRTNSLGTSRVGRSVGRSVPVVARSRARAFVAVASAAVVEGDRGWRAARGDERADADEHARRARERHHERRTTHRRHAARVRPGGRT